MITSDELKKTLLGTVVIVGAGNVSRGDDGAGSALISEIQDRVNAQCFDGGIVPENYLEKIAGCAPDTVLIVDAADMKEEPGEISIIKPDKLASGGLSTHAVSLSMMCEYIKGRCPSSNTYLLAIQPSSTKIEGLSEAVQGAVHIAAELLRQALPLHPLFRLIYWDSNMHELTLCEGLVDAILGEIKKLDPPPRLTKARVVIGVLRNVVPDYLTSAYKILTKGTAAEGSELEMITMGLKMKCKNCDWQGEMQKPVFLCDKCGASNVEISGGVDLYLESLEVEEEDDE